MASSNIDDNCSQGFTCFWKIENFHQTKQRKQFILKSQILNIKMLNFSKWYLEIRENQGNLSMFLCKDAPPGYHIIDFSITVLTSTRWLPSVKCLEVELHARGKGYGCYSLVDWKKLFDLKDVYLPQNSLTVCCHIWNSNIKYKSEQYLLTSQITSEKHTHHLPIQKFNSLKMRDFESISYSAELVTSKFSTRHKEYESIKDQNTQTEKIGDNGMCKDMDDLLFFFDKMNFCYVTLRTANKDFAVHKAVICAKSPVFCAMFDRDMKEKERSLVEIHDIDSKTLVLLLQFLHHEPLENLDWDTTVKLYYAADKYQIKQLKRECTLILKKNLTSDNICEVLVLSDMHQNNGLKEFAKKYFCKNSKKILCSSQWKTLLFKNTALAAEVLKSLAESL